MQLYTHSDYSLMQSLITVQALVKNAQKLGIKTLALTDYHTTAGHGELEYYCKQVGIKPIFGLELEVLYTNSEQAALVILAQNEEGYSNLLTLASLAPPVNFQQLVAHKAGLVFLDGGDRGRLSKLITQGLVGEAHNLLTFYQNNFGSSFYLRQDLGQNVDFTTFFSDTPIVLGQDVRWIEDRDLSEEALQILGQLGQGTNIFPPYPMLGWDDLCAKLAISDQIVQRTLELGNSCTVQLPKEQLLPPHPSDQDLANLVWEGAKQRFGQISPEVQERLEHELGIIREQKYEDYFLIVADIVKFAKTQGIPVGPGRGSAASSLVAYCLKITEVNPLNWGLLFERFLNQARQGRPDIDLDFCYERRQEVLAYVAKRFGPNHVAQIGTYGTFAERSSKQEVKRVLGYDKPSLARKIQGLKRHRSTHAAGLIITAEPTKTISAVYTDRELPVTHLDMYSLERLGVLKIDLLGLRTLTILTKIEQAVQASNPDFLLDKIPLEDHKTFELLAKGKTRGIFQLESELYQDLLRALQPNSFLDIVALLALGRPGPLDIFPEYLQRRKSQKKYEFLNPEHEQILRETYGLILYQEQVILLAHKIGGLSLGEADLLRVALGKNDQQAIAKWRQRFMQGAQGQGLTVAQSTELFKTIQDFSGYAFNKAHSVSYALLTWQAAYLKANYPLEFFMTLLNEGVSSQEQGLYLLECQALGVPILPPSIHYSQSRSIPEGQSLRLGLTDIRQMNSYLVTDLITKRESLDLTSLTNLRWRIQLDSKVWEILVLAGACDGLGSRNSLLRELGVPLLTDLELLKKEKELIGIYISRHPSSAFLPLMSNLQGELEVVVGEVVSLKRLGTAIKGLIDTPEGLVEFETKITSETFGLEQGLSFAFFGYEQGGLWKVKWILPQGPILLISPQPEEIGELKPILEKQTGSKPVILRLGEGTVYHLLPKEFWIDQVTKVGAALEEKGYTYVWFDPWKELVF